MTFLKIDHLTTEVRYTLAGIFAALVIASLVARILQRAKPDKDFRELRLRIRTWWVIAGLFSLAIILSRGASLFFLAFVSFLALKEFLSLVPTRRADHRVLFLATCRSRCSISGCTLNGTECLSSLFPSTCFCCCPHAWC